MKRLSPAPFVVSIATVVAACGALSRASYASSTCKVCEQRFVLTGDSFDVDVSFPAGAPEVGAPKFTIVCRGVRCESEPDAKTMRREATTMLSGPTEAMSARVVPLEPGNLILNVVLQDGIGGPKEWTYSLTVLRPERIEATCSITRGAEHLGCDDVRWQDQVRLEFAIYAGERRFVSKSLDVRVEGGNSPWPCAIAPSITGGAQVLACTSPLQLQGTTYTFVATHQELRKELTLTVR